MCRIFNSAWHFICGMFNSIWHFPNLSLSKQVLVVLHLALEQCKNLDHSGLGAMAKHCTRINMPGIMVLANKCLPLPFKSMISIFRYLINFQLICSPNSCQCSVPRISGRGWIFILQHNVRFYEGWG